MTSCRSTLGNRSLSSESYTPDFTAVALNSAPFRMLRIRRSAFRAALEATQLSPVVGYQARGPAVLQDNCPRPCLFPFLPGPASCVQCHQARPYLTARQPADQISSCKHSDKAILPCREPAQEARLGRALAHLMGFKGPQAAVTPAAASPLGR